MSAEDQKKQEEINQFFELHQHAEPPSAVRGILQTKDYETFLLLSDTGDLLLTFEGAKKANHCLPGDHVYWDKEKDCCQLELRDEHPPIVGTLELTNKTRYGMTRRKVPIVLFVPYAKKYPSFLVGCSEKDLTQNKIGLITFSEWEEGAMFPRGNLQTLLGPSGDGVAEKEALIWLACPYRYPKHAYHPEVHTPSQAREHLKGCTFHVDPDGCRDVDDVFTVESLPDGEDQVTITISDVAAYVADGSAIDIMASLIGQTLYDKEGKVLRPMLPTSYSEGACSLLPNKESIGISLSFRWTGTEIRQKRWFLSRFTTDISYTYELFQASSAPYRILIQEIASHLAGSPLEDAHEWVEQMMIFYNKEAGQLLQRGRQGILRRHSAPQQERLERLRALYPDWAHLAYSSAEYCLAEEKETFHYGLQSNHYAHASSPIRRYADLVNQRCLHTMIGSMTDPYIVPQAMYDMNQREKAIRRFVRDVDFVEAVTQGQTEFEAYVMEKVPVKGKEEEVKVRFYVPQWKRMVSAIYLRVSEDIVLSRDEQTEMSLKEGDRALLHCAVDMNRRNWKERVVFHVKPVS